jgi:hypothetical protein
MSTFRLLDLPTELRLLIYEHITPTEQHHTLQHEPPGSIYPTTATLTTHHLPVSLLRTSKFIHREAGPILGTKLATLRTEPLNLCVDEGVLKYLFVIIEPLSHRIQMYVSSNIRRYLLAHVQTCRSQHCHTCRQHNILYALADLLLHRRPSNTVLNVTRSLSPRLPSAIVDLCGILRRAEHWTCMPKPVHLHFRGTKTDQEGDWATAEFPEGYCRGMLMAAMERTGLGTCVIESVGTVAAKAEQTYAWEG